MATTTKSDRLSAEEKAAIRERAKELQAQASGSDGETQVLAKINEMPDEDKTLATSFHPGAGRRTGPRATHVVRHAGVRDAGPEREGGLLLPERGEDEDPLQHNRLQ